VIGNPVPVSKPPHHTHSNKQSHQSLHQDEAGQKEDNKEFQADYESIAGFGNGQDSGLDESTDGGRTVPVPRTPILKKMVGTEVGWLKRIDEGLDEEIESPETPTKKKVCSSDE
jgi:hypothetical protein